jgi:hypothetical protein
MFLYKGRDRRYTYKMKPKEQYYVIELKQKRKKLLGTYVNTYVHVLETYR